MYYSSLQQGQLTHSARRGVIQLIPKCNKDETWVKNWRPLMLLNLEYKILARALVLRMETVNDKLIGTQQQGFVKGRSTLVNILKTREILVNLKNNKKEGILISIDFEKCFDRIEYQAIEGALRYFRFGENFISWMLLLFTNFRICTKNNGFFSTFFSKSQGVNQGCPVSPGCYNLCGEVMAHLLQQNAQIKGLQVHDVYNVLSQFADNTAIFTKFEKISLDSICSTLAHVEANMGLNISYDNTNVYRISSLHKSQAQLYTQQNLRWTNGNIHMLGVHLMCEGDLHEQNFQEIVTKVDSVIPNWYFRTMTLMGRVTIVNALIGSLFSYKMMAMMVLTDKQIRLP